MQIHESSIELIYPLPVVANSVVSNQCEVVRAAVEFLHSGICVHWLYATKWWNLIRKMWYCVFFLFCFSFFFLFSSSYFNKPCRDFGKDLSLKMKIVSNLERNFLLRKVNWKKWLLKNFSFVLINWKDQIKGHLHALQEILHLEVRIALTQRRNGRGDGRGRRRRTGLPPLRRIDRA